MSSTKKPRIEWIDAAKGIGCLMIFLSHMGTDGGNIYAWVASFNVQLFFFLSGCLAIYNRRTFFENIVHKFITIMIPFYFFGIISFAFRCISKNTMKGWGGFLKKLIRGGIRNEMNPAGALWFLTCLFAMEVIFALIKLICRGNKLLVLAACLAVHLFTVYGMNPSPVHAPKLPLNFDSAAYFLIFYALGWALIEPLNHFLNSKDKRVLLVRYIVGAASIYYTVRLYFGSELLASIPLLGVLSGEFDVIRALITTYVVVIVSNRLKDCTHVKKLGVYSLYFCGNEYLSRHVIEMTLSIFGVSITLLNPVSTIIYACILIEFVYWAMVPVEKPPLTSLQKTATGWAEMLFGRKEEKSS